MGEDLAQERPTAIKSWMEAKATAPLYEWKPNSLITFAIAVDSLYQPSSGGRKEGDVSRITRRRCLG